jgi:cytochrome c
VLLVVGLTVSLAGFSEEVAVNLGTPLTAAEIEKVSITIFPDGHNLPEGQGSVKEGEELYFERCAVCHGESGTEGPSNRLTGSVGLFSIWDPFRIQRIQNVNPLLVMSTGQQWPYAAPIFDFVRRAMPHVSPKSLTNNQVYALTAFILNMNDLIDDDSILDRDNLALVEMPAFKRYVQNCNNINSQEDLCRVD